MSSNARFIAAAKRAAKALVRARADTDQPLTYQQALDTVAREVGRAHWATFLADPIAIARADPAHENPEDVSMLPTISSHIVPPLPPQATHQLYEPYHREQIGSTIALYPYPHHTAPGDGPHIETSIEMHGTTAVHKSSQPLPSATTRLRPYAATAHFREFYTDADSKPQSMFQRLKAALGFANPNHSFNYHLEDGRPVNDARWATSQDIARLAKSSHQLITADPQAGSALGRTEGGEIIALSAGLSAICIAPAGTGKTSGLVVPNILLADKQSLVIHDPKQELIAMTSGHRATLGPVHVLDFSRPDAKTTHWHASFNPLSPDIVPSDKIQREIYIRRIVDVLLPRSRGSGSDSYWADKARPMLTGLIHFIVDIANDPAYPEIIPADLLGRPASLPLLAEWIRWAISTIDEHQTAAHLGETEESPKSSEASHARSSVKLLLTYISDRLEKSPANPGTVDFLRSFTEETVGEREVSAIFMTAMEPMRIFLDPAVAQRTSRSTFQPKDLRGVRGTDGTIQPVTLYLATPTSRDIARLNALVLEVLAFEMFKYVGHPDQRFFPINFILDEFGHLGVAETLLKLANNRPGPQTSIWIFSQSYSQIETHHGRNIAAYLRSGITCQIFLNQSDLDNPHPKDLEQKPGHHIALISRQEKTPLRLKTMYAWECPEIAERIYNRRLGTGPAPVIS